VPLIVSDLPYDFGLKDVGCTLSFFQAKVIDQLSALEFARSGFSSNAEICSKRKVGPIVPRSGHMVDPHVTEDGVLGIPRVDRDLSTFLKLCLKGCERVRRVLRYIETLGPDLLAKVFYCPI
jgi:hypothetical protein